MVPQSQLRSSLEAKIPHGDPPIKISASSHRFLPFNYHLLNSQQRIQNVSKSRLLNSALVLQSLTIIMRFLATLLSALTATPCHSPGEGSFEERGNLAKRQSCKRKLRFRPDQNGVCVDTRSANPCRGGALYTGLCPGTPNYVLCCIQ